MLREELQAAQVVEVIKASGSELLQKVNLFDVYTGDQVDRGFKSLAFRMVFQSKERTLTETEVNAVMDEIMAALAKKLQISLR